MTFEEWYDENEASLDWVDMADLLEKCWNTAYQEGRDDEVYDSYEG